MMAASTSIMCTCRVCIEIRVKIDRIFRVLDIYGWILDSYVVDFFQDNLWEKLPESWRHVLQDTSPQEFGKWLSGDIWCTRVWPLSLLALRKVVNVLQINRDHRNSDSILSCVRSKETKQEKNAETAERKLEDTRDTLNSNFQYDKFQNLFSKHIKKKKRYEIQEIAQICADSTYKCNTKCIVDIGSGMGHLARVLAFQYGLYVTCIEQDCTLLEQARKCDTELLLSIQKHLPNFSKKGPQHVVAKLESSDPVNTELIRHLQESFKNNFSLSDSEATFGFVGLHPCGDLASILLKLYTSRKEAKFICIVGCCYMKMTLQSERNELMGYPLSNYLMSFRNPKLSYTALEVACHAIEKYCDKLKTGDYKDLIVHAYRAALETILLKKSENLRHSQVKNVKVTRDMTFQQYCAAATSHLPANLQPQNSDFDTTEINEFLRSWQQVIIFGSLRTMLAPLIETIVLFDRFLYLSEKDLVPTLKPVFDARQSPRNFVLISTRDNMTND